MGDSNLQRDSKQPEAEQLKENEPYLGLWWAVLMFVIYLVKEALPAEMYSFLWWSQVYIIAIMVGIVAFVVYKRLKFFRRLKKTSIKNN